jgi:hypothetical protein
VNERLDTMKKATTFLFVELLKKKSNCYLNDFTVIVV